MGRHLQAVSPSPASLQIPASIGEVVDKITILELRAFGEDYPEAELLLLSFCPEPLLIDGIRCEPLETWLRQLRP